MENLTDRQRQSIISDANKTWIEALDLSGENNIVNWDYLDLMVVGEVRALIVTTNIFSDDWNIDFFQRRANKLKEIINKVKAIAELNEVEEDYQF